MGDRAVIVSLQVARKISGSSFLARRLSGCRNTMGAMASRVLLIDDHSAVLEFVGKLLAERYEVTVRRHALDIVSDFDRLGDPVVVLDVSMPELDGIEAAKLLQARRPHARIVFLSSDSGPHQVEAAIAAGGRILINKTRAAQDLVPAIEAALTSDLAADE